MQLGRAAKSLHHLLVRMNYKETTKAGTPHDTFKLKLHWQLQTDDQTSRPNRLMEKNVDLNNQPNQEGEITNPRKFMNKIRVRVMYK